MTSKPDKQKHWRPRFSLAVLCAAVLIGGAAIGVAGRYAEHQRRQDEELMRALSESGCGVAAASYDLWKRGRVKRTHVKWPRQAKALAAVAGQPTDPAHAHAGRGVFPGRVDGQRLAPGEAGIASTAVNGYVAKLPLEHVPAKTTSGGKTTLAW